MERQAKLDLVIKEIEKAKRITPKGQQVKVYLPNVLKHNQLRLEELQNILAILEDDEKILTVMRFPRHLLKLPPGYEYTDMLTGEKSSPSTEYFTLKVRRSFNKWCANYWKLTYQQAGSVKWTEKDVLEHARMLKSPFEKLDKPNDKMPKRIWRWAKANKVWSAIIVGIPVLAALIYVIDYFLKLFSK